MLLVPVFEKDVARVQKGDTEASLAERYDTDVSTLRKANDIAELYEGQLLLIRRPPRLTHKVMPTDTLSAIAARYGTTEETILRQNGISRIYTGQDLVILP